MLTQKQRDLLLFIHERMGEAGVPPSFDEMKDALELKSKSGIHRLITALEERGFIRRLAHRARAIEVLRLPDSIGPGKSGGVAPSGGLANTGGLGSSLSGHVGSMAGSGAVPSAAVIASQSIEVPMMGRIAAGVPISAIQEHTSDIGCPADMLGRGEHFALEVNGDSMIEAGINDGDTVIIKRCETANNGDIVVALVDKEEATLKRLYKKGTTVQLEAANPAYETRILGPDQVDIQGKLVGLIRRY